MLTSKNAISTLFEKNTKLHQEERQYEIIISMTEEMIDEKVLGYIFKIEQEINLPKSQFTVDKMFMPDESDGFIIDPQKQCFVKASTPDIKNQIINQIIMDANNIKQGGLNDPPQLNKAKSSESSESGSSNSDTNSEESSDKSHTSEREFSKKTPKESTASSAPVPVPVVPTNQSVHYLKRASILKQFNPYTPKSKKILCKLKDFIIKKYIM